MGVLGQIVSSACSRNLLVQIVASYFTDLFLPEWCGVAFPKLSVRSYRTDQNVSYLTMCNLIQKQSNKFVQM